ncbi:MAG: fibronectin type III domain-containing protein [Desulfobacteraceae bacterium]|nr:fibronectin type III domain-containing protein [Desulfobacteraceae bacterium]
MIFHISKYQFFIPSYVIPKTILNTNRLLKQGDLVPNDIEVLNYSFGEVNDMESNRIDFVARNFSSEETLESIIVFEGLKTPIFPVHIITFPLDVSEYIFGELQKIESIRQSILQYPEKVDKSIAILAQSETEFRNAVLRSYLYNNLIDYEDINDIINESMFSFQKSQLENHSFSLLWNKSRAKTSSLDCKPIKCPWWLGWICALEKINEGSREVWIANQATSTVGCSLFYKLFCNGAGVAFDRTRRGMKRCKPVKNSVDPNEIIGTSGYNQEKWISKNQTLPYTILFENDPELATAPAQVVSIRQTLDSDLDPRTFRLGTFGFGDHIFNIPENTAFYSNRLDLTDSLGIYVDVNAGIDITTNEVFWVFRSIDPETGQAPTNPLSGFLPVNDPETHVGEGFVNYTIKAENDAKTGDVIDAQATIVFDINDPIDTPPIFNTIDADTPSSQTQTPVEYIDSTTVRFSWTGNDPENGSGFKDFTLYMATDDNPYEIYESDLTDTSLAVSLIPGHTYRFFTIAADNAGNTEPMKTEAEATADPAENALQPVCAMPQPLQALFLPKEFCRCRLTALRHR